MRGKCEVTIYLEYGDPAECARGLGLSGATVQGPTKSLGKPFWAATHFRAL